MARELIPSMDETSYGAAEQGLDLSVYLDILRRRYLFLIIPAVVGFAAVCAVVLFGLPPVYQATAKILVQSQLIPTDLAASTVTAGASERIRLIEQRLTTRDNLLEIARKFDLYKDQRGQASPSELVGWIRGATQLEQMDNSFLPGRNNRGGEALGFTLSFEYRDPVIASRVANELVSSILQQNIQTREARADETSKFFQQQVEKLEDKLAALEARIAEFKKANQDSLPDTLNDRRQRLAQLQTQMLAIDHRMSLGTDPQSLMEAKERVHTLNSRLETAKQLLKNSKEQRSSLDELAKKGYVTKPRLMQVDNDILKMQTEIDTLTSSLKVAESNLEQMGGGDPEFLPKHRAEIAKQAEALSKSILKTPDVEATLSALSRDYQNLQAEYQLAKSKTTVATTGQQMEEDRQAERFEVVEQASVPDEPIKPDRPRLILAGALVSILAGAGLVMLMEGTDRSIRSSMDLERALRIRPLMVIPYVVTTPERRRKRWTKDVLFRVVLALIVVAAVLMHELYKPLDILILQVVERIRDLG